MCRRRQDHHHHHRSSSSSSTNNNNNKQEAKKKITQHNSPYGLGTCAYTLHSMLLQLSVGRKPIISLPPRYCDADCIRREVDRLNPPFVVHPSGQKSSSSFSVRKRVFLSVEKLSIECENENELCFACKLIAMDHNQWQTNCDETLQSDMDETVKFEMEAKARMESPLGEVDFLPSELVDEEEDISIDEWGQMGYKWFNKEEVIYL